MIDRLSHVLTYPSFKAKVSELVHHFVYRTTHIIPTKFIKAIALKLSPDRAGLGAISIFHP